jgi:hypothetical protein
MPPPTSTQGKSWCHRGAGGENRGRGQGGHTRPRAGREDRGRGSGRYTWAGAPTPNLAPGWWVAETVTPRPFRAPAIGC